MFVCLGVSICVVCACVRVCTFFNHQYFNVSSVRLCVCVCVCVTDVTSTNELRLRENTREDCDVIICVHS